jgi:hypothetical protein
MDITSRSESDRYRRMQQVSYELLEHVQEHEDMSMAEMCLCLMWAAASFVDKENKRLVVAQFAEMADKAVITREQEGL